MFRRKTVVPRLVAAAVMLSGLGLVTAAASPGAASPPAARPAAAAVAAAALPFGINGPWTDNGSAKPVITSAGDLLVIDMSYAHRPTASGHVIDASSIYVTFPDAGPYIGTFLGPTVLQWSNGSIWQKVYTAPTVIDLNDNWTNGPTDQHVTQVNGFVTVNMSQLHRPNGTGFFVNSSMFLVSFPDDPNTTYATIQAGPGSDASRDRITWSNGSYWVRLPLPPGNPVCLQQAFLLC
jgi:hypothetical protein